MGDWFWDLSRKPKSTDAQYYTRKLPNYFLIHSDFYWRAVILLLTSFNPVPSERSADYGARRSRDRESHGKRGRARREGTEDKRAPLAAPGPRLVPLSSSSWKQRLQAQGVERRRQKTRFQLRDVPPAPPRHPPTLPRLPPASPPGRARQPPGAKRGAGGGGADGARRGGARARPAQGPPARRS
nr:disintegrin and metalloproteinase domain-containing protein 15-like [Symphalangus syndactylus]